MKPSRKMAFIAASIFFSFFAMPTTSGLMRAAYATSLMEIQNEARMEGLRAISKPPVFRTLQWNNPALVLTGEPKDPLVAEQMQIFKGNAEALAQRNLVMIRFLREDLDEINELSNYNYRGWYDMDAEQQSFIERQLGTDNGVFSVVLVGIDGELKQVWNPETEAVDIQEILATIDSIANQSDDEKDTSQAKSESRGGNNRK